MGAKKNPVHVIIFTLVTLGLYSIYWWYQVFREWKAYTKADYNPLIKLITLIIPLYNIYVIYKFLTELNERSAKKKLEILEPVNTLVVTLVGSIFFGAGYLYLIHKIQSVLNTHWEK